MSKSDELSNDGSCFPFLWGLSSRAPNGISHSKHAKQVSQEECFNSMFSISSSEENFEQSRSMYNIQMDSSASKIVNIHFHNSL